MSGSLRISSGRLVPSVASISPSARSRPSVFLGHVVLDGDFFQERQHGRAAMRARRIHRALHPVDFGQVDAELVLQHAVDEDGGGHRIKRHADALAFEVLRRLDSRFTIDGDEAKPERDRGKHRDGDERAFFVGEALDEFGARIFRNVEFLPAGHAVEDRARLIDGDEIQVDAVGLNLSGIERQHPVIEPARKRQLQLGHERSFLRYFYAALRLACAPSGRKAGGLLERHALNAIPCAKSCRYCFSAIGREIRLSWGVL